MCDRWLVFENFLSDMGERPSENYSLDRIDPNVGYEPNNCRWLGMIGQQNNRTNNRRLPYMGETLTLQEWSRRMGIPRETIARRLDVLGWGIEKALTTYDDI